MGGAAQLSSDLHMPWASARDTQHELLAVACCTSCYGGPPQGVPAGFCLKWVMLRCLPIGQGLALNGKYISERHVWTCLPSSVSVSSFHVS